MAEYLNDVQQLRCLAVIVVILFHLNLIPTGFRGVDIFFVISGFILTSQHIHRPAKSLKGMLSFWLVRSRRIVPAAYLILVLFFIYFINIAHIEHPELYLSEFKSAVNFYSNFHYYYMNNDYFHPSSSSVFLNFWSLSTEMQYYIFFPIIIMNNQIILFCFIISFIVYQYYYSLDTNFNYYSMIPRVWEFLFGTFIIKFTTYNSNNKEKNDNEMMNINIKDIIIKYSFFIILFILSIFKTDSILLQLDNLVTMILTSLFIYYNPHFINSYIMEHIGDLSYIIYLIHFPLKFIIINNYFLYFTVLYLLSAIVYYLFEKPILIFLKRMQNLRCGILLFFILVCCNIFCVIYEMQIIKRNEKLLNNYNKLSDVDINITFPYISEELNNYCCYKPLSQLKTSNNNNNNNFYPILFIGDSHALRYIGMIRSYISFLKQPFYFKYVNTFYIINNMSDYYIHDIDENFDIILLSNLYMKSVMGNETVFVNEISNYIIYLLNYCKKLIFFKPTPVLDRLVYCDEAKKYKYAIEPYNLTMNHQEYTLIQDNTKIITFDFKDLYCQNQFNVNDNNYHYKCNLTYFDKQNKENCVYYDRHHIDMQYLEYHMNYILKVFKDIYNIKGNFSQTCMYYYYKNKMFEKWHLEDKGCDIINLKDVV